MSHRPQQPILPVPDDAARVACAAFCRGNACLILSDRLGTLSTDTDFADLYPKRGHRTVRTKDAPSQDTVRLMVFKLAWQRP